MASDRVSASDHKALPLASTVGDARGGVYYAICQECRERIWLDLNNKEGWKHDN